MKRFSILAAAALLSAAPLCAQGASLTTLLAFDGSNGAYPNGDLAFDATGNLYGAASGDLALGGTVYNGTVFKLTQAANWAPSTVVTFTGPNGSWPRSGVLFDATGNAFGTTATGGPRGLYPDGTAYEIFAATARLHTVTQFLATVNGAGAAGSQPKANLIFGADGNLYGTTSGGSSGGQGCTYRCGTVFRLDHSLNWHLTTLVTFKGSDGADPQSRLLFDSAGNLYGTTIFGGANDMGTVFRLSPPAAGHTAWKLTTLATFDGSNGAYPYPGVVADAAGNLYGTTNAGGANSDGTVFKLKKSAKWALSSLVTFDGSNGVGPRGALAFDTAGNLYGTTSGVVDGSNPVNNGTVFKLKKSANWQLSTIFAFDNTNGAYPFANLLFDASGILYGTTLAGGNAACNLGCGTVFKLVP